MLDMWIVGKIVKKNAAWWTRGTGASPLPGVGACGHSPDKMGKIQEIGGNAWATARYPSDHPPGLTEIPGDLFEKGSEVKAKQFPAHQQNWTSRSPLAPAIRASGTLEHLVLVGNRCAFKST